MKSLSRLYVIILIFLAAALLLLSGCSETQAAKTIRTSHDTTDLFIGDRVKFELGNIPEGLKESDYEWKLSGFKSNTQGEDDACIEHIGGSEFKALRSGYAEIEAEAMLNKIKYKEVFDCYIYSDGAISIESAKGKNSLSGFTSIQIKLRFPEDVAERDLNHHNKILWEADERIAPYIDSVSPVGGISRKTGIYNIKLKPNKEQTHATGELTLTWGRSKAAAELTIFNEEDPFQIIKYLKADGCSYKLQGSEVKFCSPSKSYNRPFGDYKSRLALSPRGKFAVIYGDDLLIEHMMNLHEELLPENPEEIEYVITIRKSEPFQVGEFKYKESGKIVKALVSTCDLVLIDAKTGDVVKIFEHYVGKADSALMRDWNVREKDLTEIYVGSATGDFKPAIKAIWAERNITVTN